MSNDHSHALMEHLGLTLPILQAPMAGVATPELAAAVTQGKAVTWDRPPQGTLAIWAADDKQNRVTGSLPSLGIHREPLLSVSHTWPAKCWAEMTALIADPGPLVSQTLAQLSQTFCTYCGHMSLPQGCLLCGTWPNMSAPTLHTSTSHLYKESR